MINKDNNIVHELKASSLWFKEHGRNTNTSIIEVCDRAAEYIKELESEGKTKDEMIKALESKISEGEINMHETTLYCPGEELPFEDKVKAHTKRTDMTMSVAHALLTIHNVCKENKEKNIPCEQCVLADEDGLCGIIGKFPSNWKFELRVR